ncbi:beta-phosphoglucomutase family hydrolase [Pontibacter sp. 172403-2]|uniref:HAD family hydrolase n=1 Tax=Pontibacter rufus TaxID=2791028 RepID=UPI0018AFE93C|nr:beta-phosphoglucomutase family hydrolase [Pontibacter sp. 172403-2]MBF9254780.1 beta-phosphoglucomutase family hydrolase [Pontibacter sp. 172403-2]
MNTLNELLQEKNIKALILDMDGVVTHTAKIHADAWKRMADTFLRKRGEEEGKEYEPMDADKDYRTFVSGVPRHQAVRDLFKSRGIELPEGTPDDYMGKETVVGLGNLKNMYFLELIKQGVEVYEDAVEWLKQQQKAGRRIAVVSSSKNCHDILQRAGLERFFEERVDGLTVLTQGLHPKPAPDIFLEAAKRLGVAPGEAAVFEDAVTGIQAAKAGNFALVVGIDRDNNAVDLQLSGADLIIHNFENK